MKHKAPRLPAAFTLIEMLAVIAIIGILASLLLPAIGKAKQNAQKGVCKVEEANLVNAINQYYSEYSRWPVSTNVIATAGTNDWTAGTQYAGVPTYATGQSVLPPFNLSDVNAVQWDGLNSVDNYQSPNSEIMNILMDLPMYPESNYVNASTMTHFYNPQRTAFFNAKTAPDTNSPGLDPRGILRDIWGSPYIITLDINGDHRCFDPVYSKLTSNAISGDVLVWSFGPDRKYDQTPTSTTKDKVNLDNVLSWQ